MYHTENKENDSYTDPVTKTVYKIRSNKPIKKLCKTERDYKVTV